MNQVVQMFKESNARMKKILSGKYEPRDIEMAQREFEGQIRLANVVINAFAVAAKNKRAMAGLGKMNIMDEHTAIDMGLGDPEADKVKCPVHEKLIARGECMEYSGSHYDDCKGCEIGAATKNILLGEK